MFFIKRPRQVPPVLSTPPISKLRSKAKRHYRRPASGRAQESFSFEPLEGFSDLTGELITLFRSKCAFCETGIVGGHGRVHRLRPAGGAVSLSGKVDPDHYWWLAYDWENLYLLCETCSSAQGSRFPIRRKMRSRPEEPVSGERPLLLDPCINHPARHLKFSEKGRVRGLTEEGRTTVDLFRLNRAELVRSRLAQIGELERSWKALLEEDPKTPAGPLNLSPSSAHLAMSCQILEAWIAAAPPSARARLGAVVDTLLTFVRYHTDDCEELKTSPLRKHRLAAVQAGRDAIVRMPRRLEWVQIWNFKGIEYLRLDFESKNQEHNWKMLLGTNAAGKSSILQAIAFALMGQSMRKKLRQRLGLVPKEWVRNERGEAVIQVKLTDLDDPYEVTITTKTVSFKAPKGQERPAPAFLLGYGSTRLIDRKGLRPWTFMSNVVNITNLFDPLMPLVDPEKWLRTLPKHQFDLIAQGIKILVGMDPKDWIFFKRRDRRPRLMVRTLGATVLFRSLSEGFLSVVGLATALMSFLRRSVDAKGEVTSGWERMEDAEGIVLIDEIETHLHPKWKLQIVGALRRAFPKVQFIVTTHDPLCLRGLEKEEIALVKRDPEAGHRVSLVTDLPDPKGLRADQLLTSEYFGLGSTVDPEFDKDLAEYYALLAMPSPSAAQKKRREDLEDGMDRKGQFGSTRRERLMYQAIDRYLAVEPSIPKAAVRKKEWVRTLREVRQLARQVDS